MALTSVNNLSKMSAISSQTEENRRAEKIWSQAKAALSRHLSLDYSKKWLDDLRPVRFQDQILTLRTDSDFLAFWLSTNYADLIQEIVQQTAGEGIVVHLVGPESAKKTEEEEGNANHTSPSAQTDPEDSSASNSSNGLNPNYRFEHFIVGPSCEFAFASAQAVAQRPGRTYNPLFIYGGTGLGKTHLLHAIGHHVQETKPYLRVCYVTSERFTNEYIEALQNRTVGRFRKRYRSIDVLLIDDIQFLSRKERIQEEFFHTFNALHEARKQIVLTCDRPVGELKDVEARLVSRFEWGLVADLQPPEMETRVAILKAKQRQYNLDLPDPILQYIAENIRTNVRKLEGALARLAAYSQLSPRSFSTKEEVQKLIGALFDRQTTPQLTIERIQKEVASFFDLRVADLCGKRRPEPIVLARQIAMYLCRELTGTTLTAIGEAFGGRDHGTVLYACRQIKTRMEVDSRVREQVERLRQKLLCNP